MTKRKERGPLHRVNQDVYDEIQAATGGHTGKYSAYHYRVVGDGWAVDWWPLSGKWMLPRTAARIGTYERFLRECVAVSKAAAELKAAQPPVDISNDDPGLLDLDARTGAHA